MKKLSRFTFFDFEAFIKDKTLRTNAQQVWKDFNLGIELGTKIECVIIEDNTDYGESEEVNNRFEKFWVKVPKKITVPMNVEVRLKNVEATIYGEYKNMLSCTASDIEIVGK